MFTNLLDKFDCTVDLSLMMYQIRTEVLRQTDEVFEACSDRKINFYHEDAMISLQHEPLKNPLDLTGVNMSLFHLIFGKF